MTPQTHIYNTPLFYRRLVWGLMGTCGVLLFAYVFLVGQTVFAAVARKSAQSAIATRTTDVGALETKYLQLTQTMTPDYAKALGYTVNPKAHFVSRAGLGKNVTFNNAR